MTIHSRLIITVLLGISGLLLSSLVPGGPIENRNFSHINPTALLVFNVFLTVLGIGSFLLFRYVLKGTFWSWRFSILAGLSYLLVYGVDLAEVFPKTPSVMSPTLFWVEITGFIIAIPLVLLSFQMIQDHVERPVIDSENRSQAIWKFASLAMAGLAIIIFATWSAMNPAAS